MAIGSVTREHGVLKLVHPKGRVELHKSPVTAAQVMKKNPRHCVARPDVFKYPWIVVRPESVLKLGKVYFIVPHHTLRRLLESNGLGLDHSSLQHPAAKHKKDANFHVLRGKENEKPRLSSEEVDDIYDQLHGKDSTVDELARFHQLVRRNKAIRAHEPPCHKPNVNLIVENLQDTHISLPENQSLAIVPFDPKNEPSQRVAKLRSCLKKHKDNSTDQRPRGPRVRFEMPVEENKGLRFRVFHFQRVDTP